MFTLMDSRQALYLPDGLFLFSDSNYVYISYLSYM